MVEIAPSAPHIVLSQVDPPARRALLRMLEGIDLTCVSINPPELNLISPNPEIRELGLRHYMASIDLAGDLGAGIVVVVAGRQSPLIPMPADSALELALRQLTALDAHARKCSVKLAVETVPYGLNETAGAVATMVDRLGSENVGMALDVANIFGREDVGKAVEAAGRRLLIAHLSDTWRSRWAHTSLGAGEVDFPGYFRALALAGFQGPCIYELVDGEDPAPRIGPDLRTLESWGLRV